MSHSEFADGPRDDDALRYREHRRKHYLKVLRTAMEHHASQTGSPAPLEIQLTPDRLQNRETALSAAAILLKAEPAPARLFAAVLLEAFDAAEARRALELMKGDSTPVLVPFGNILTPRHAGDIAADLLADRDMCFVPPL